MASTKKSLDVDYLRDWVGREETATDLIDIGTLRRIGAFFDRDTAIAPGDPVDETWHWCFFHPATAHDDLSGDGHLITGGFLPPFALPRRMWGGSSLTFHAPLLAGKIAEKTSRVLSVDLKQGKSGALGLVKVEHLISQDGTLCRREEQDIVYREAATGPQGAAKAPDCPEGTQHRVEVLPDPVRLFRYSALTYNAHRIHYDRTYATSEEGYPGLVVHGPLTASLLAGFARSLRAGAPLKAFSFRGTSPLFDSAAFTLNARSDDDTEILWAERPGGGMAMSARAEF